MFVVIRIDDKYKEDFFTTKIDLALITITTSIKNWKNISRLGM